MLQRQNETKKNQLKFLPSDNKLRCRVLQIYYMSELNRDVHSPRWVVMQFGFNHEEWELYSS